MMHTDCLGSWNFRKYHDFCNVETNWHLHILASWHLSILTSWHIDILTHWYINILTYLHLGIFTSWHVDILIHWHLDILTSWYIDILAYCTLSSQKTQMVAHTSSENVSCFTNPATSSVRFAHTYFKALSEWLNL